MTAETDTREGAPTRDLRRSVLRLLVVAGVLGVLVALGLPAVSMLQPKYYERYDDLHTRMENWTGSTHALVPCYACHVEPGAKGMAEFAVKSIPAFYSQLISGPSSANLLKTPSKDACRKCHSSYRQVSANGDLLIPHRAHVEVLGINCADCHSDLVHSKNTQGYNAPEMSMCLESCHDGEQASNQCADCHTRKHVPPTHKRKDWLQVHSTMVESEDCDSCHAWSPDYCSECHSKRPASHKGNWKKDHAVPAKARGDKGCLFCHEGGERFCKECHD